MKDRLLAVERRRHIVEEINRRTGMRVKELAQKLDVTEETIRRDLEILQKDGLIVRSHGGAIALTDASHEVHYAARETRQHAEKTAIAREALKRIKLDDTILMDSSSTALVLARQLPDMRITVLTNSIQVAEEMASRPQVRVIGIGGTLMGSSLSFVGPLAEQCLSGYHVGKAFLSCKGFSLADGVSESNELQALLKRQMVARSDERYLLVDGSKVGKKSLSVWAQVSDLTEVITDSSAPSADLEGVRKKGIRVTIAP